MSKEVTVILDEEVYKKLRKIQGLLVEVTNEHWSFSKVVEAVILTGLDKLEKLPLFGKPYYLKERMEKMEKEREAKEAEEKETEELKEAEGDKREK